MTDATHVAPPTICTECLSIAHTMAEVGPPLDAVFAPCRHNGAIGLASKQHGRITHWNIQGPIPPADFDAFAHAILSAARHKGIHAHPIAVQ